MVSQITEGLAAIMPMSKNLGEYLGIKPGDARKLIHKLGFGDHWNGVLDDTFRIKEIIATSVAIREGLKPATRQYRPEHINVIVQSVEHSNHYGTISIEHFLPIDILNIYN